MAHGKARLAEADPEWENSAIFLCLDLTGQAAQEGTIEREQVQVVAEHLDLDDQLVGLAEAHLGAASGA